MFYVKIAYLQFWYVAPQHRPLLLPTSNDMSAFVNENQASQTVVSFGLPVVLVSQQQPTA